MAKFQTEALPGKPPGRGSMKARRGMLSTAEGIALAQAFLAVDSAEHRRLLIKLAGALAPKKASRP
jgi:hypothetical protein